jgi:hypothetical protein
MGPHQLVVSPSAGLVEPPGGASSFSGAGSNRERPLTQALRRLAGPYVYPHGLKGLGIALSLRAGKYVHRGYQLHVSKAGLGNGLQVLSFQESPANSSRPEVHVGPGRVGHRTVHHNIREAEATAGPQDSEDLTEHLMLIRAQVYDPVGDCHVH